MPSATWPTITAERSRSWPDISEAPPALSVETRSVFEAVIAGIIPKTSPETAAIARPKPSTSRFTPASAARGTLSPISRSTAGVARNASAQPTAPPAALSTRLSTSSCRTILVRLAPSAVRIAISRRLSRTRASSRLPMLPQAISSTSATAQRITTISVFVSPSTASSSVSTRAELCFVFVFGYFVASRPAMAFISWSACAIVTPGFSLPIAFKKCMPRLVIPSPVGVSSTAIVVHTPVSGAVIGNRKAGGITPITVNVSPLS